MTTPNLGAVKRTACDRCHGQKMRCIRDSASVSFKCNRCIAANAECNFSLARKAGRPPSNKQSRSQSPKSQTEQDNEKLQEVYQTHRKSASLPTPPSSSAGPSSSVNHLSPEVLSIFDTASLVESPTSSSSLFLSTLPDTEIPELDFPWVTMDPGQDMEALWLDPQLGLGQLPEICQSESMETDYFDIMAGADLATAYDEQMQKLATLSGQLFSQINQHHNDTSPMENLEKLTAHVISSSSSLLEILKSLRDTLARQQAHTPGHMTPTFPLDTQNNTLDTATTLQILTAYIRLTQLHYTLYTRIQDIVSTSTSFSAAPPTPSTPGSASPTLPAFPSLAIGGISLAPYSRFQLKFLLQICVHHLGEIEVLLGLPAGFRVSEVGHGEGEEECSEILAGRNGGTAFLVRAIMMGAGTPVKDIGEILERLKKALEGRIQV